MRRNSCCVARNYKDKLGTKKVFYPRFGWELPGNFARVESLRIEFYFIPANGQVTRNMQRKVARQSFRRVS
jgi:hypothetical protein